MKPTKNDRKKFDLDLQYGTIREEKIAEMLTNKKIEVKSERDIWQKEITDQIMAMNEKTLGEEAEEKSLSERMKGEEGKTKGELYRQYHEWDKKLQDMINSGEYDELSEEEKAELEISGCCACFPFQR